jgi:hypothetical protein
VSIDIPVEVAINVDTRPFDASVGGFARTVNSLSQVVVATGSAHAAAIVENGRRVADAVLNGFFTLVRSELTQQTTELRIRCESLALKLNDMMSACRAKKTQMENDYGRIASRYTALFQDLDRELSHRIRAIDGTAFDLHSEASAVCGRPLAGTASTVASVASGEDSLARAGLGVCVLRSRGLKMLQAAGEYLASERMLNDGLRAILRPRSAEAPETLYVPVLFVESEQESGLKTQALFFDSQGVPELNAAPVQERLKRGFSAPELRWRTMEEDAWARTGYFLDSRASAFGAAPGSKEARVAATMQELRARGRPATPDAQAHPKDN